MNSDEVDDIFKLMDRIMRDRFYGGYMTPSRYDNRVTNGLEEPEEYGIDIQEDDEHIYFTVELRGIEDEDMNVIPKENSIKLEIMAKGKWHRKNFRLPAEIVPEESKVSFNNCILDMILKKAKKDEE